MEVKEFVSGGKKTEDSKKNMKKKINSAKKNYAKKNSQFTIAELKENSALIMLCVFVVLPYWKLFWVYWYGRCR